MKPELLQQKINRLVTLALTEPLSYSHIKKEEFHRLSRAVLKEIAIKLGLKDKTYQIRSNKAGEAVSGEITLHGDHIYIQFSQSILKSKFMWRLCLHNKDYTGLMNRWMEWSALQDFDKVCAEFKKALDNFAGV